ncbi:DUF4902 domain-containing protein [Chitinimonas sp. JJ19]|uniref:DUF4902 domain-containing protein n=1 Tax=Chitinimonas sp. JJ19 TaxID=3109352 RepID=UPI001A3FB119|nr:DUF4902 domain-containing protein [Chitinimonas sp.]
MHTLAPDGLIRLTYTELRCVRIHLNMAWSDMDLLSELLQQGVQATDAGYCEYVSDARKPCISLGWAWYLYDPSGGIMLAPGGISSNVMLRCEAGYDLGAIQTGRLLESWINEYDWQVLFALEAIPACTIKQ